MEIEYKGRMIYCDDSEAELIRQTLGSRPEPDDEHGSSAHLYGVHEWSLQDGRRLYIDTDQGMPCHAEITTDDLRAHVAAWDCATDNGGTTAEWLELWGLDGKPPEASADDAGPFCIWCDPHFYGALPEHFPGYCRVGEYEEIEMFETYAEAAASIKAYYTEPSGYDGIPACNVMAHGQAGPDSLTIVFFP